VTLRHVSSAVRSAQAAVTPSPPLVLRGRMWQPAHGSERVAVAVRKEGHPLDPGIVSVDEMRRLFEGDIRGRQALVRARDVVDYEVPDRTRAPLVLRHLLEVKPHAAAVEEDQTSERVQVDQAERVAVEGRSPSADRTYSAICPTPVMAAVDAVMVPFSAWASALSASACPDAVASRSVGPTPDDRIPKRSQS
jgi:hypothetical protein